MGGGPSAAEREATRRAEENAARLRALQEQEIATRNQLITLAQAEDPLETRLRARDMSWLDWEDQKDGPLDVSKAPLGPALGLYDRAVNRQQGERRGIGALSMGLNASDPKLAQLLEQQSRDRQQQEAAGDLENAVRMKSAEVNRSALPLAAFAQDRRMGLASLASGNANAAGSLALGGQNSYIGSILNRPQRPSFWRTFSQAFGGSLGSTLGSTLGGGNASGGGWFGAGG